MWKEPKELPPNMTVCFIHRWFVFWSCFGVVFLGGEEADEEDGMVCGMFTLLDTEINAYQ